MKWDNLQWTDPETGDVAFSTNCSACIRSPRCSVLTDVSVHKRRHVVGIRLRPFADRCKLKLVATYQPIQGHPKLPDNVCHWEIAPIDEDPETLAFAIQVAFGEHDESDPRWHNKGGKEPPKDRVLEAEALARAIGEVIEIHRNVGVPKAAGPPPPSPIT